MATPLAAATLATIFWICLQQCEMCVNRATGNQKAVKYAYSVLTQTKRWQCEGAAAQFRSRTGQTGQGSYGIAETDLGFVRPAVPKRTLMNDHVGLQQWSDTASNTGFTR